MSSLNRKDIIDTSRTQFEMRSYSSSKRCSGAAGRAPSYSVSSFSHHNDISSSESDDDVIGSSMRLNCSRDNLTEEEDLNDDCAFTSRFDSAIDLSTASLDRGPSVSRGKLSDHECRCDCHHDLTSKLIPRESRSSCSKQKPLQVSISFPICTDGSYADPRNLSGPSPWFVSAQHPRSSQYDLAYSNNSNSNNNKKGAIVTTNVSSCSSSNGTAVSNQQKTDQRYELARKTYVKNSNLMSKNKWLCVVILALAIVTLATIGALVYFVIFSIRLQGENDALNPDSTSKDAPFIPKPNITLNQTCGTIPSKYLPEGVRYQFPFIQSSRTTILPPINDTRTDRFHRIIDGKPANIAHYPWQKSGWSITARLWLDNNHSNNDLPIVPPVVHRQGRIVGSKATSIDQFPWQAALFVKERGFVCGGTVVLSKWIITAVHCMEIEEDTSKWVAHFGSSSLMQRNSQGESRSIVNVISNHNYFKKSDFAYDYDIALLQLDRPLPYTKFIQPICVPPQDHIFPDRMKCYISGWGLTTNEGKLPHPDVLRNAQIDIIGKEMCNRPDWLDNLVTDRMLCAGKIGGGRDSCQGDSGGPLSCYNAQKEIWMVAGIVSWGIECGLPNFPGVYTKISYFTDWIFTKIAQAEELIPEDPTDPDLHPNDYDSSAEFYDVSNATEIPTEDPYNDYDHASTT